MPWAGGVYTRTNGTYTGTTVWAQDAAAGVRIQSARHDTHDQDIANGLNNCLTKDGTNTTGAAIVFASVGAGTSANNIDLSWDDALHVGSIVITVGLAVGIPIKFISAQNYPCVFAGALIQTGSITVTPGTSQNDYTPAGLYTTKVSRVLVAPSANISITGLTAPDATQVGIVFNLINTDTTHTLTLTNQDAASSAANRFILPSGLSLVINPGDAVSVFYDSAASRWRKQ